MSKENWKKTGKELGGAFEGLAKTLIRSAATGVSKVEEWAEMDVNTPESNVFKDGTWRKTGKELGEAMKGLGKTLLQTGEEAVSDLTENKEE